MNINNSFPSDYLKSGDIVDDETMTLTVNNVETRSIGQGENEQEKPVVFFDEVEKGLVLNKTNAGIISEMYGPETDGWIGKKLTLFVAQVDFQGKPTQALRVKLRKNLPNRQQTSSKGQAVKTATPAEVVEWITKNQASLGTNAQANATTIRKFGADIGADLSEAKSLNEAAALLLSYAQEMATKEAAPVSADQIPF